MVPQDQAEIGTAACRAIERLLARVARDRESILQGHCEDAEAGVALLNALARRADEMKRVLQDSRETTERTRFRSNCE